jgi:C1A family cysteine protease
MLKTALLSTAGCLIASSILLCSAGAQSALRPASLPAIAFGPEHFVEFPGGPAVAKIRHFTWDPQQGPATVVVVSGDREQNNRVTNAVIVLNGTRLFAEEDFQQATLRKDVDLLPENTLSVELEGAPGRHLGIVIGREDPSAAGNDTLTPIASLPTSVDWRTKGAVTPVKDQGQCSASWAFGVTGAVEGDWFINHDVLTSLSEQQLIDCSVPDGTDGCEGDAHLPADGSDALTWLKAVSANKGGSYSETRYPYSASGPHKCKTIAGAPNATIHGYKSVTSGSESALETAVAAQPVLAMIDASHASFQVYSSGVYSQSGCSTTKVDHAVLIVGYGTEDNKAYWIVKNSWGTAWGEKGYILMSRDKNNQCGIATDAYYPD